MRISMATYIRSAIILSLLSLVVVSFLKRNASSSVSGDQNSPPTPRQVLMNYWNLASKGSRAEARKLLTNAVDLKDTMNYLVVKGSEEEGFTDRIYSEKLTIRKLNGEQVKGKRAIIVLEIIGRAGRIEEMQCRFVNYRGEWKIYSFWPNYSPDDPRCKLPGFCDFLED